MSTEEAKLDKSRKNESAFLPQSPVPHSCSPPFPGTVALPTFVFFGPELSCAHGKHLLRVLAINVFISV